MINWRGTGRGPRGAPATNTLLSLSLPRDDLTESLHIYGDNRVGASHRDERRPFVKIAVKYHPKRSKYIYVRVYNIPSTELFLVERIRPLSSSSPSWYEVFISLVGGRGRPRFGRSFPSTIIPENSYLSRTFDTYDRTLLESGKKQSSERFDLASSLALFVFAPTILLLLSSPPFCRF